MSPFSDTYSYHSSDIGDGLAQLIQEHANNFCGYMLQDHLNTGGKRLRAKISFQLAELFGLDSINAEQWAVAVELLHNATLVHDDIQDGDKSRRNQPTTWVKHGVAQAINTGDLGLVLPYQCIEKMNISDSTRWRLAQTLSKHSISTVCGQSLEMTLLPNRDFSLESYTNAALGKTGAFFGLPMEGIAYLAKLNEEDRQELTTLFTRIGLLFQMQDDILDCFGNKGRKRGADICEGKISTLVVHHLQLHPQELPLFVQILENNNETPQGTIDHCIELFAKEGALDLALETIRTLEQQLCSADILLRYPHIQKLVQGLIDTIMYPIQHLFLRSLEMTQ